MKNYRNVSFWFDTLGDEIHAQPCLEGSKDVDVAIIGAGYTGLWTAYYLKTLAPELSVAVLEANTAGFGASGRNGGWLKGSMAGEDDYLASLPSDQKKAGYALLHGIVDHVHGILQKEGMECGFAKGGVVLAAARYPEQLALRRKRFEALRKIGHTDDDYRWLDAAEMSQYVRMRNPGGAIYSPHCAVINPGQLIRGLASVVQRKGVALYEKTPVTGIERGVVRTEHGTVRAKVIVPAVEGYASSIPGLGKFVLPVQSLIVATEPLSGSQWDEIGLATRPAFSDGGRIITYGQKSPDGRLIFGARGIYQFGAKPRSAFSLSDHEFALRKQLMVDLFPSLKGVQVTHGWGGTMGVARKMAPHVVFDSQQGIALAGGYGGGGVGASNLFGRTLADLILQRDTELTRMPWVINGTPLRRALRKWEPEPIPWLVYQTVQWAFSWEEALCRRVDAPVWRKQLAGWISGTLSRLLA